MVAPAESGSGERPIPTYLVSQAQEKSLHPASQAEEANRTTKQKKVVSRESGQTICRQPNAPNLYHYVHFFSFWCVGSIQFELKEHYCMQSKWRIMASVPFSEYSFIYYQYLSPKPKGRRSLTNKQTLPLRLRLYLSLCNFITSYMPLLKRDTYILIRELATP
jgi:hypothetical protein